MPHSAAALLYSGVTAARSVGDGLDASLKLRKSVADGAKLGAQLFVCGPMFTAEGGHGTEFVQHLPAAIKDSVKAQLVRTPKTPEEARKQVRELKSKGVDGIKAILEAGWGEGMLYDRLDLLLVRAVSEEAHAQHLPLAIHTGDARDVADAVEIGSSQRGTRIAGATRFPTDCWSTWRSEGVYLDPTLAVAEAYALYFGGKPDVLNHSLVQQVVPARMLKGTREFVSSGKGADAAKAELFQRALDRRATNLLRAWKAGVPLVMGSDAGNPMVFHGPSLHRELQLWVQAGIPAEVALQAATVNAAKLLGRGRTHRRDPAGNGRGPAAGGRQSAAGNRGHRTYFAGGVQGRTDSPGCTVRTEVAANFAISSATRSGCSMGMKCEASGSTMSRPWANRDARSDAVGDAAISKAPGLRSVPARITTTGCWIWATCG